MNSYRRSLRRHFTVAFLAGIVAASVSCPPASAQRRALPAPAETAKRIQDRSYHCTEADKDLPYSLFVPAAYDGAKPYPLVVALHGLGSSAAQIIRYRGLTDLAERHGYIVAAPMGYNDHGWYGSLGPGKNRFSERLGRGASDPANLGELSEKDVFNVLDLVEKEFKIDTRRVYLLGHSMGGGGTYFLGIKHKELWAALAPIAPAVYSSPNQLASVPQMPIIVVQGDADRLVDVRTTRRWVEKMNELNIPHEYIEVPGGNHVTVAMDNLPAIFTFFDHHVRAAAAK